MGLFDKDPKHQRLKEIRDSGYDGPLDKDLNKVDPLSREADALDALRRLG
ncbi:hypothetical protein [Nonomuraea sp. NPDC050310]